jgi:tripartite-type tricarboxylate transporter receptor subunit TctC
MIDRRSFALGLGAMSASTALAQSNSYPSQSIKIIIPNPPGGPGDVVSRAYADRAQRHLGQTFVFDYRPGASTTIGTNAVVNSEADGYTILGFPSSGLAVTLLRKDVPYNLERDLKPIVGLGSIPMALMVKADSPYKTVADLAAAIKAKDLSYGSGGPGTLAHLSTISFLGVIGGKATHVPFRGNPDVIAAMLAGQLDFFFGAFVDVVAAGDKARVLAITSAERSPDLPNVPTTAEAGMPGFTPSLWYAFMAPAKTPDHIVARLRDAFFEAAKDPELISKLRVFGVNVKPLDPSGLAAMMKEETARWSKVIEQNNLALNN